MPVTVLIRNIWVVLLIASLLNSCGTPKLSKPSDRDKAEVSTDGTANEYSFGQFIYPWLETVAPDQQFKQDSELARLVEQINLVGQAIAAGDSQLAEELAGLSEEKLNLLPVTQQAQWYKSQAYLANIQGDLMGMLRFERQMLIRLPTHQRMARNSLIFARLLEYNWMQIKQVEEESGADVFAKGWFELVNVMTSLPTAISQQQLEWSRWRKRNLGHSADRFPPAQIAAFFTVKLDTTPLALMLPLSGSYADFGKALQTGFNQVVAHPSNWNWRVNTFDVVDQQSLSNALIQVAAKQLDTVVGPIDRNLAQQVWNDNKVDKQLALNYVNNTISANTRVQFGLSVEDEAQWIAKMLNANQNLRVAVLQQVGRNPIQAVSRFTQKIKEQPPILQFTNDVTLAIMLEEALGVSALDIKQFKTKLIEYRKRVEGIADLTEDIDRLELQIQLLEEDPVRELRKQVLIDVLVVFADSEYASRIKPLLHFYYAENVKVIAYSAAFDLAAGEENRDTDGLFIVDIPATGKSPVQWHEMVNVKFPIDQQFFRFYAMGVDTALLVRNLERLIIAPGIGIRGATGRLSYDVETRSISRDLELFKVERGKLVSASPEDLFTISCEIEQWKIEQIEGAKNTPNQLDETNRIKISDGEEDDHSGDLRGWGCI